MQKNFGKDKWLVLMIFGLIGQIAWSVENMYFNMFVFYEVSPDLDAVTLMVQLSGVVATVATLVAGTLSDKTGNRRLYICWGYIIWGITVALFGALTPKNMQTLFNFTANKAVSFTLVAVIVGDSIMTLFGSTANDACFNAWVTDNTEKDYRGKVESVLSILPLVAMLIVAGGFGILVDAFGYFTLFAVLGAVISACGVLGLFKVKDSVNLKKSGKFTDIFYGFRPSVIKNNKPFYVTLLIVGIYGVACQIFMPFLIIYMKTYLGFTDIEYSLVFGGAIIVGAIVNLLIGRVADKFDKVKVTCIATAILALGLLGMYFAKGVDKGALLALFGLAGLVMICGYIFVSALTGATVRDYTPTASAGKLQGVRMIFSVLIPMLLGPMLGNSINKKANIPLVNPGADAMTTSFIPAPEIFLAASGCCLLIFPIIYLLQRTVGGGNKNKKQPSNNSVTHLKTDYEVGEIPHAEHPSPQCERASWLNLNGKWQFKKINIDQEVDEKISFDQIIVPFSPETLNSGIGKDFALNDDQKLVYRKMVNLDKEFITGRVILHFGAVDSYATVFVNGKKVGEHECGFTSFEFDVTEFAKFGENVIEVHVTDNFHDGARGKQNKKRGGIWYTPQSGIWQTVWLESMPDKHIRNIRYDVSAKEKSVKITSDSFGLKQTIKIYDGDKQILSGEYTDSIIFNYDFKLWSPESPNLYDVVIENGAGDRVKSYFGVRDFGIVVDKAGKKRLSLNGKPYFFSGVLDQGYWSDGMLTHPSDKAIIDELQMLKDMGFNTVRKHIKNEPMRWYYHCDRLGLCVWQDFVNGGGEYKFNHIATFPFLGFKHKDSDYKYFARQNEKGREEFKKMAVDTVNSLYNCTCISAWVIFNEGWGQFDSKEMTDLVLKLDSSRVIDSVSGWHDQGQKNTTLLSMHTYYTPLKVKKDSRAVVLSEFGGYSMKVDGHVYDSQKEFGYKKFKNKEQFEGALEVLFEKKLKPLIVKGLSASIYTQVSDVEEETNGLVTYDRKVQKVDSAFMKKLNLSLQAENDKLDK